MTSVVIAPDSSFEQLHNDYLSQMEIDGRRYKSVTHFVYSQMMPEHTMRNFVMNQIDGLTARKKATGILFGKKAKGDRKLAQASEYIIMKALEEAYTVRFQNPQFQEKLLGTGTEPLVYSRSDEYTYLPGDTTVLGLNQKGNGQNKLGVLLEQIRFRISENLRIARESRQLTETDRIFRMVTRHDLLMEQLYKGHFPVDYSLEALFCQKHQIPRSKFEEHFAVIYPLYLRDTYTQVYRKETEVYQQALRNYEGAQKVLILRQKRLEQESQTATVRYQKKKQACLDKLAQVSQLNDPSIDLLSDDVKVDPSIEEAFNKLKKNCQKELQQLADQVAQETLIGNVGPTPQSIREVEKAQKELERAQQEYTEAVQKRKEARARSPLGLDVLEELEHSNLDWVEREYQTAFKKQGLLQLYLQYLKIDYETLVLSLAKQKFLDLYWSSRFKFVDGKPVQLSLEEYCREAGVVGTDMLYHIGTEALTDLREHVYNLYLRGELMVIPELETRLGEKVNQLWHTHLGVDFAFPKFVPIVDRPSVKFLSLISDEAVVDPVSPRETYSGTPLDNKLHWVLPEGACSDEPEAVCPLGGGPGDDSDGEKEEEEEGLDFDQDERDDEEKEEEGYDLDENEEEEGLEEGDTFGDFDGGGDFSEIIEKAKQQASVGIRKYTVMPNPVRFGTAQDYPYEWMSPDYLSMLSIGGYFYPSVSHYVMAKLGTPVQFRNLHPRLWIQKDPKYNYQPSKSDPKALEKYYQQVKRSVRVSYQPDGTPVFSGGSGDPRLLQTLPDRLTRLEDFLPLNLLRERLPTRIQQIYNQLYLRYADRALHLKMKQYPFRPLLFSTKGKSLVYFDENRTQAVAGNEIVQLLTQIRNRISSIEQLTPVPGPVYDPGKNRTLFDYINERTTELIRATVLFAKYRMTPRDNYVVASIPILGFEDARFALQYLYPSCRDVNYNDLIEDAPDKYRARFGTLLNETVAVYLPGRNVYDANSQDSRDAIRLKAEGRSEDKMTDKLFVHLDEIIRMIWTHIVYMTVYLEEDLPEHYDEGQLRVKIKELRGALFSLSLGSVETVAVRAVLRVLENLHLYTSASPGLTQADLEFLNGFLFPVGVPYEPLLESESYNRYPELIPGLAKIYGSPDQPLLLIKRLAYLIDRLVQFPNLDKVLFNKLTIRLKFFASS